jgi:hypothetical protein
MAALALYLDPASVDQTQEYINQVRQRILAGLRAGMMEAMEGLAWNVADKLSGNPIVSRSGDLLGAVIASPHVSETAEILRGTVHADVGAKHVGLWLEEGTHVPAVENHIFGFSPTNGETVFTRGHKAFAVRPHPFMNPSLHEFEGRIIQILTESVEVATAL